MFFSNIKYDVNSSKLLDLFSNWNKVTSIFLFSSLI
ncbi:MAG: hypothetical protein ACFFHV_02375 [Promethearchaeota archaeon]